MPLIHEQFLKDKPEKHCELFADLWESNFKKVSSNTAII